MKSSAVERTAPLQYDDPDAIVVCTTCEESSQVGKCSKKDNTLECPACGAPIEGEAKPLPSIVRDVIDKTTASARNVDVTDGPPADDIPFPETATIASKKPAAFQPVMSETRARAVLGQPVADDRHEPPPKAYCGECGSELPIVKGAPWFNCGHGEGADARRVIVDDPNKARRYSPPAGTPRATILGRTLYVSRGRHAFPTVPYGSFHVGPFNASAELGPDANILEVARGLRAQLRHMADEAFEEELEWYEKKLERVKGE